MFVIEKIVLFQTRCGDSDNFSESDGGCINEENEKCHDKENNENPCGLTLSTELTWIEGWRCRREKIAFDQPLNKGKNANSFEFGRWGCLEERQIDSVKQRV